MPSIDVSLTQSDLDHGDLRMTRDGLRFRIRRTFDCQVTWHGSNGVMRLSLDGFSKDLSQYTIGFARFEGSRLTIIPQEPVDLTRYAYVSRYEDTEHYGGPEEGGWHFTIQTFTRVVKRFPVCEGTTRAEAEAMALEEAIRLNQVDREDDADADYVRFACEDYPGEYDNTQDPMLGIYH